MSDKMKNLVTRTITGVVFIAVMVGGIVFRPDLFIVLLQPLRDWLYGNIQDLPTI